MHRLTCHRYSEAIELLYSSLSFDLVGLDAAYRFLSLVPPQRLQQIRCLQLSDIDTPHSYRFSKPPPNERHPTTEERWLRVCSVLQTMNLESLKITIIKEFGPPLHPDQELKMLTPLVGIRTPANSFLLRLLRTGVDRLSELNGATFEVLRVDREIHGITELDWARYGPSTPRIRRKKAVKDAAKVAGIVFFAILCCPCIILVSSALECQESFERKRASLRNAR